MNTKNAVDGNQLIDENPDLQKVVNPDTEIKNWLVEYVGEQLQPANNEVTLEMIIEVVAKEFPEFLLSIAEENFIRGYKQALEDAEEGRKLMEEDRLLELKADDLPVLAKDIVEASSADLKENV